jgi:regulator of protease activity HflC (stomatin/prohibitin superfamily)
MLYVAIFVIPLIAMFIFASVKMIPQYERGIVFRMGKVTEPKGPGMVIVIPLVDKLQRVDMRTITHDVPGQDIITKDNVSVRVSAVVYFKVVEAVKASVELENYKAATSQLAKTTLRSV